MKPIITLLFLFFACTVFAYADYSRNYTGFNSSNQTIQFTIGSNQVAGNYILVEAYTSSGNLPSSVTVMDTASDNFGQKVNTPHFVSFVATGIVSYTSNTITIQFSSAPTGPINVQAWEFNDTSAQMIPNGVGNPVQSFLTPQGDVWTNGGSSRDWNAYKNGVYTNGNMKLMFDSNGTIYGIDVNTKWEQYNPSTNSWTTLSSAPHF